ncbi:MAG TPA: hypothetical protein VD926_13375 [Acidimicrobiales bacterium]|nr:hypothetical protein [Acidimicrobiales bacterium]
MTTDFAQKVSSAAAALDARPAASGVSSWQLCAAVPTAKTAEVAIRFRMHGNGYLTARRPKERSEP